MDLYQLRGFFEIAREGSFTRAADKLFLTQPAISLQIKALEQELGEILFERMRKSIRLTPAGEVLYRRVQEVFDRLEVAREEIAALRQVLRGRLVIGTSDTNCTYLLPGPLQQFRRQYAEVELDIRNRMSAEIGQMVLGHEVDFGLATLPAKHRDLVSEELFERSDVLVCRPDHPLAQRKYVRLQDVVEHPLLALERGSTSRRLMEEAFIRAKLELQPAMNLASIEVIKRFVEIGMGIAVVPRMAVEKEAAAGLLQSVRVRGLAPRTIGLIEHRGRRRSPAVQAFLDILRDHIEKTRGDSPWKKVETEK